MSSDSSASGSFFRGVWFLTGDRRRFGVGVVSTGELLSVPEKLNEDQMYTHVILIFALSL